MERKINKEKKKVSFAFAPKKNRCDGRRKVFINIIFFFFSFALTVEQKNWLEKVERKIEGEKREREMESVSRDSVAFFPLADPPELVCAGGID